MHLLIAHPGHELLLHGWISRTKPTVSILTDGSGSTAEPRLDATAGLLDELGARRGAVFGRFSDREAYAMIANCETSLVLSVIDDLAADLQASPAPMLVTDAAEGYNPVHDLCRLVGGAAVALAGVGTKLFEYAVVDAPSSENALVFDLDAAEYETKMARSQAASFPDAGEQLSRHGAEAFRREALRPVADWAAIDGGAPPRYERFGEERVAAGLYGRVIRRDEHMMRLRDAVCAALEKRSCAF